MVVRILNMIPKFEMNKKSTGFQSCCYEESIRSNGLWFSLAIIMFQMASAFYEGGEIWSIAMVETATARLFFCILISNHTNLRKLSYQVWEMSTSVTRQASAMPSTSNLTNSSLLPSSFPLSSNRCQPSHHKP